MPLVPRGLERRSVGPGDMKSLIVEEMSILWSAIGGLQLAQGGTEVISRRPSNVVEERGTGLLRQHGSHPAAGVGTPQMGENRMCFRS